MKESNPFGTLFLIVVGFLFIAIIIKLIPLIKFLVNFILFLLKVWKQVNHEYIFL